MKKIILFVMLGFTFCQTKAQTINDLTGNDFFSFYKIEDGLREVVLSDKKTPPYWAFSFDLGIENKRFQFKSALNDGETEHGNYEFKNNVLKFTFDEGKILKYTVVFLDKNVIKLTQNKSVYYLIREPNKR
jgi:hypothetical protein